MEIETSLRLTFRTSVKDQMVKNPEHYAEALGNVLHVALKKFSENDVNMEISDLMVTMLMPPNTKEVNA